MIFGPTPLDQALGAHLAHSLSGPSYHFKKGHVLTAADLALLAQAGLATVIAARFEDGDVPENEAASAAARPLIGPGLAAGAAVTGRVNLVATQSGMLCLDPLAIRSLNRIDEGLTVASLPDGALVSQGQIVATIKIIPFAVDQAALAAWQEAALAAGQEAAPVLRVAPFRPRAVALIQTTLPATRPALLDKMRAVTSARLAQYGATIDFENHIPHETAAIADAILAARAAGAALILIAGASAITDRRDVVPAGLIAAGGTILRFGMPVDPGNLLLLGDLAGLPVLGLPGCARSPKLNGLDHVLARIMADQPVDAETIIALGAGGLLAEIPSRPWPRARGDQSQGRIAALILAAGRSSRMGRNKMTIALDGVSLLERTIDTVLAAGIDRIVVVLGHEAEAASALIGDRPVQIVHNPDYAEGLSTSLKAGLAAIPAPCAGALVLLADMPGVTPDHLATLMAAFQDERDIVVPMRAGRRGNPILWGRSHFPALMQVTGDQGGRDLLWAAADHIRPVECADDGVLIDLDTPEALAHWLATR